MGQVDSCQKWRKMKSMHVAVQLISRMASCRLFLSFNWMLSCYTQWPNCFTIAQFIWWMHLYSFFNFCKYNGARNCCCNLSLTYSNLIDAPTSQHQHSWFFSSSEPPQSKNRKQFIHAHISIRRSFWSISWCIQVSLSICWNGTTTRCQCVYHSPGCPLQTILSSLGPTICFCLQAATFFCLYTL